MKIVVFLISIHVVLSSTKTSDYKYVNYDDFMRLLETIKSSDLNNDIFQISDGFERYSIYPRPTCNTMTSAVCKNPIIEIGNFNRGEDFVKSLPTLLLIGGFHGNEVIGTNVLYYLIELFMKNYKTNVYFHNLLDSVHIVLLPMSNVNGFFHTKREETSNENISYDPNRDFPFNLLKNQECFRTSTALLLDAIFRNHLIVGCLTFHGGDNSITYPWGDFSHKSQSESGDNVAFKSVSNLFKNIAGNNPRMSVQTYETGTMQNVVYDVRGGFEDWAYGASHESGIVNKNCGVYENPRFDLYKNNINYDHTPYARQPLP